MRLQAEGGSEDGVHGGYKHFNFPNLILKLNFNIISIFLLTKQNIDIYGIWICLNWK